jgi:hypothetical protein
MSFSEEDYNMTEDTWKKLDQMFEDAPMMKASTVSLDEVTSAFSHLDFELPQDYKDFVCRYGGATVGPYSVYGLRAADTMGDDEGSALSVTQRFQDDGWKDVKGSLVVSADHSGNPVLLRSNGEIWIVDHDNGVTSKLADNFEGYLLKCIG